MVIKYILFNSKMMMIISKVIIDIVRLKIIDKVCSDA